MFGRVPALLVWRSGSLAFPNKPRSVPDIPPNPRTARRCVRSALRSRPRGTGSCSTATGNTVVRKSNTHSTCMGGATPESVRRFQNRPQGTGLTVTLNPDEVRQRHAQGWRLTLRCSTTALKPLGRAAEGPTILQRKEPQGPAKWYRQPRGTPNSRRSRAPQASFPPRGVHTRYTCGSPTP